MLMFRLPEPISGTYRLPATGWRLAESRDHTIEFNFRDAKQYWGLEDFMNVKELPVTNAANLAFCMVNLAQVLRQQWRPLQPDFNVLDLKAHFRGLKYVAETLKLFLQAPEPIVISQIAAKIAPLGAVNAT